MKLREKIGIKLDDYQQESYVRFCDYLDENKGRENDPAVKQKAEDIRTFSLGEELHNLFEARAHIRATKKIAKNHKEYLRCWYVATFYMYKMIRCRIRGWLSEPFCLFTLF